MVYPMVPISLFVGEGGKCIGKEERVHEGTDGDNRNGGREVRE
jgi:hypothetical protein